MPELVESGNKAMSASRPLSEPNDRPDRPLDPVGERPTNHENAKEYYPPKRDMLKEHEINISFFNVGCLVRVGCKTIAFNTTEEAMEEVNEYVANPRESVKKWNKIFNANE